MIDPRKVTNFERTNEELEEFLLFSIVVAGKGAFQQATKLDQFLTYARLFNYTGESPFELVKRMDECGHMVETLRAVKMGQYERISTAFRGVATFFRQDKFQFALYHPLQDVDVQVLECVKGIGMKTARFFLMHTRPNQEYACLDTHILRWLGARGHEVPKITPRGEKYLALEKVFLGYCKEAGKSAADMDLEIWNSQHLENSSKKNLTAAYSSAIVAA
jgi:thermostable 8-oxoguanine DNA glycosylase